MRNAAVIVETRKLPNLIEIIKENHMRFLPDWELIVITTKENVEFFREGLKKNYKIYFHLEKDFTVNDYNQLLTSYDFWNNLAEFNRVLIFQHDSIILRKGIEEFMEYDYVGAPWKFQQHGGNGGLSLRNPKSMLRTILYEPYKGLQIDGNEDVYFSNHLIGDLAPREVCSKFSCESIFEMNTFGYHAIDKYLPQYQCNLIKKQYDTNDN